jgi:hypothetical protein
MSRGEPQRLATWILTRCTPAIRRDSFVGDLMEQYEQRGGWWYWRQALGAVRAHTVRLLLAPPETHVPASEYIGDLVMGVTLCLFVVIQLPIYADLVIRWTHLIRSQLSIVVVCATISTALIVAATTTHQIRKRTPSRPRLGAFT